MEFEDDFEDHSPSKTHKYSVYSFRPVRAVAVCLGLLCFLLLAGIIGLILHCCQKEANQQISYSAMTYQQETKNLDKCSQGWHRFQNSCYFISPKLKTWNQGKQDCVRQDANLVIINSRNEHDFLKVLTTKVWIGLSDQDKEGRWKWVDGSGLTIE
ncbi:hypothetical protein LDENG_00085820 [Lucifuga dentata]|nr:hypothetical protein LDENG_00085820 [Lucifuga dentata]